MLSINTKLNYLMKILAEISFDYYIILMLYCQIQKDDKISRSYGLFMVKPREVLRGGAGKPQGFERPFAQNKNARL